MSYEIVERCACCSGDVEEILDLGQQPLANNLINEAADPYEKYDLKLNLCKNCYHTQLSIAVDPALLYENYLYISGTSRTLRMEFDRISKVLVEKVNIPNPSVLDIASNDGTFLKSFQKIGCATLGVEPAKNISKMANEAGIETLNCFFGSKECRNLIQNKEFDLITAFNVLAHIPNPLEFIIDAKNLLSDNGVMAIQTSQKDMFYNGEFDTIYHEHHYFYSIKSFSELCKRAGLYVDEVMFPSIHGNSYLFIVSKNPANDNAAIFIEQEEKKGRYSKPLYVNFTNNIEKNKDFNLSMLKDLEEEGYYLIGYGAAAKAIVMLNYYNLRLEYIVDENPLKYNKIIPNLNTQIIQLTDVGEIIKNKKPCFIILAWNFFSEISNKIDKIYPHSKKIVLMPNYEEK